MSTKVTFTFNPKLLSYESRELLQSLGVPKEACAQGYAHFTSASTEQRSAIQLLKSLGLAHRLSTQEGSLASMRSVEANTDHPERKLNEISRFVLTTDSNALDLSEYDRQMLGKIKRTSGRFLAVTWDPQRLITRDRKALQALGARPEELAAGRAVIPTNKQLSKQPWFRFLQWIGTEYMRTGRGQQPTVRDVHHHLSAESAALYLASHKRGAHTHSVQPARSLETSLTSISRAEQRQWRRDARRQQRAHNKAQRTFLAASRVCALTPDDAIKLLHLNGSPESLSTVQLQNASKKLSFLQRCNISPQDQPDRARDALALFDTIGPERTLALLHYFVSTTKFPRPRDLTLGVPGNADFETVFAHYRDFFLITPEQLPQKVQQSMDSVAYLDLEFAEWKNDHFTERQVRTQHRLRSNMVCIDVMHYGQTGVFLTTKHTFGGRLGKLMRLKKIMNYVELADDVILVAMPMRAISNRSSMRPATVQAERGNHRRMYSVHSEVTASVASSPRYLTEFSTKRTTTSYTEADTRMRADHKYMLTRGLHRRGNSGSALFNSRGEVVAIVQAGDERLTVAALMVDRPMLTRALQALRKRVQTR